jgi:hypothetical protein
VVTLVPLPVNTEFRRFKPDLPIPGQAKSSSHTLPLSRLTPHERVTNQFQDYGIVMQNAIAVQPSNPSFTDQSSRLHLMPLGKQAQLRLILQKQLARVELRLRGYRDFRIDALDHDGHSLTAALIHRHRQDYPQKAPEETIAVDTAKASQLVISSSSAYVLHHIHLYAITP